MELVSRVILRSLLVRKNIHLINVSVAACRTLNSFRWYSLKPNPNLYIPIQTFTALQQKLKGVNIDSPKSENKRTSSTRKSPAFTPVEDDLILTYVEQYGDTPETWKKLANALDRKYPNTIKLRWKFLMSDPSKERKRYTKEEDELILAHVEKYGINQETWENLAKQLNVNWWQAVKTRHAFLVKHKEKNYGKYTRKEDDLIIEYVTKYGDNVTTFKDLADKLNRPWPRGIWNRYHKFLINRPAKPPGKWSISEDKKMMEILFQGRKNMDSIDALNSLKGHDFADVSTEISRTTQACFHHWQDQILPILKKQILGLPQGKEWMEAFLIYLIDNKVKHAEKIEYNFLVENKFPGETNSSLTRFANTIKCSGMVKGDSKEARSKEPLHETCLMVWKNPSRKSSNSYLGNEKKVNAHLEYAEDILTIYKSLIATT